jgi:hypothetical protein
MLWRGGKIQTLLGGALSLLLITKNIFAEVAVSSQYGQLLNVDVDLAIKGGEYSCVSSYATGAVSMINATIYFNSTESTKSNLHFLTVIKYDGAEAGDCIQIGGGTERCNHLYAWPTEWTTDALVGQTYTALVNVTDSKYIWAPGVYTMCFGDSDLSSGATDSFSGSVSFPALVSEPENTIVVSSAFGAPLELEIDLTVSGGQYSCISSSATGDITSVVANIIFNSTDTTSAVDLLFVIKYATAPLGDCIQIGGSVERCTNLYAWPTEWNADAVNGQLYTATIDVSDAAYNWPQGEYQFCFGNSEPTSGYDNFVGTVAVQDLTSEPALFAVSSAIGETLAVDFNVGFGATDYACIDAYASGTVNFFNASVMFTSTNPDQISLNFVAVIKYADAATQGDCIQVGGAVERCVNYFTWPSTWYTDAQNGNTYTALVDVSGANYARAPGAYTICIGNSDTTEAFATFTGDISFPALVSEQHVAVSSSYGELLAVDLDLRLKGGEYSCISSYATGAVNFINASIYFTSTDTTKSNLHFLTVIKYDGAEAGDCIQIGGGTERCNHLYAWPTEWTTDALVGQTYTALVNVTDSKYIWAPGVYTMCFGDSDLSSGATDSFSGSVSFPALVSEPENTIVVSSAFGAPLELEIDLTVSGGQYSCISSSATGDITSVVANIIFNSTDTTSAVDLLFVIKYATAPLGDCIQIGGSVERCTNLYAWPTEWNADAVNGQLYTATIDVSDAAYNWPQGEYQFCFGNSEPTSGYDNFVGTVAVQDLTSEPALFAVSSAIGETLAVDFNVGFGATDYACIDAYASGTVNFFNASVMFTSTNPDQISLNFVAVIKYADAATQGDCIQVGGAVERCVNYFTWPSTWYTDAQNGNTYTALVDVSGANYARAPGAYTICIGNSDTTEAFATFTGDISFPALVSEQMPLEVTSDVGEILEVSFDVTFTGGDYLCVDTFASGAINLVNASILFTTPPDSSQTSLDIVAVVKYATAAGGDCIQVGKFEFFGGNGERCSNYFDWPSNFDSAVSGSTYTASVDVSSANYVWPAGVYTVCIGDGSLASSFETYKGSLVLPDLISELNNKVEVVSQPGEVLEVDFALEFAGGDYVCLENIFGDGSKIDFVNASLLFTTNDITQTSLDYVVAIKYSSAAVADCIQIGRIGYLGGSPERCTNVFDWPTDWTEGAKSGQSYSALVDVSSANYQWPAGAYTVCFADASLDSVSYDSYQGRVQFPNLKSTVSPPTSSPTSVPKKNSNDDDNGLSDTSVILMAVLIPAAVIGIAVLCYFAFVKNAFGFMSTKKDPLLSPV